MTAIAARRAGVSSMPLSPIVGVAARDRLVDRRELHEHEARRAAQPARDQLRDLDVEADHRVGMVRARLDERRAALGVARPAELQRFILGRPGPGHAAMAKRSAARPAFALVTVRLITERAAPWIGGARRHVY